MMTCMHQRLYSEELAYEGLKELFEDEYQAHKKIELDMSFRDFLEEFCS